MDADQTQAAHTPVDRAALLRNVRSVVIKIGTNALSDATGRLDTSLIAQFAAQVAALKERKVQVTMVSSGAIGAGITELGLPGRPKDLPMLQAAAAVGQPILMNLFAAALRPHGLHAGQILITRSDFEERGRYLNLRNSIHALHRSRCVPVINENDSVAVAEIRFGDNDLIAAEVTNLLRADLLILLSVVDGLLDPDGKTIPIIQDMDDATGNVDNKKKSSRGTGGMGSKLLAADTVKTAGEPVLIANGKRPNVITELLSGVQTGTLILPSSKKLSSRSRWIGLTARTRGTLVVDDGAAKALKANKSLLATGIKSAEGDFEKGDALLITDMQGKTVARGLTNYCRGDVDLIKGHKSSEFPALLKTESNFQEVIHRDDLVLVHDYGGPMVDARYNIVLIDPPGYGHAMAFWEVALLLEASLGSLGIPVTLQNNRFEADATNIVLGYHLFPDAAALRGLRYIPYQLEQFSPESTWITPAHLEVLRGATEVWEYSERNLPILQSQGIGNVKLLPLGYHPKLEIIAPLATGDKIVDVLHYGSLNPRRQKILTDLQRAGLRVESLMGVYGRERDESIARTKLVVCIHYYQAKIMPQVRIAYLLNNGVPVVCETSEEDAYPGMIATGAYESLTDICVRLAQDGKERESLGRHGHERFRERPMMEYLKRVL